VRLYKKMHDEAHNVSRVELMGILKAWDRWTEENGFDLEWKKRNGVLAVHDGDNNVEREHDGGERIVLRGESGYQGFVGWAGLDEELEDTEAENDSEGPGGGDLGSPGETQVVRRAKRARVVSMSPEELGKELERDFVVAADDEEEEPEFGFTKS
jgi:hypothetical protein